MRNTLHYRRRDGQVEVYQFPTHEAAWDCLVRLSYEPTLDTAVGFAKHYGGVPIA